MPLTMWKRSYSVWCCWTLTLLLMQECSGLFYGGGLSKNISDDFIKKRSQRSVLQCPAGWIEYHNKCYGFFGWKERKENWEDANQKCLGKGSTLVSIHSQAEQDFLALRAMEKGNCNTWIGLREKYSSNYGNPRNFRWSDYTPFDFQQWYRNEPNNFAGFHEECIHFWFGGYRLGKWNDLTCNWRHCYICQIFKEVCTSDTCQNGGTCTKDITGGTFRCSCKNGYKGLRCEDEMCDDNGIYKRSALLSDTENPAKNREERSVLPECPDGWEKFGDKCYKAFTEKETWENANKKCTEIGSTLVSIHSDEEQEFLALSDVLEYNLHRWIGLKSSTSASGYDWSDGSAFDFEKWGNYQPNGHEEECVLLSKYEKSLWHDYPCEDQYPYICQIAKETLCLDGKCGENGSGSEDRITGVIICSEKNGCNLLANNKTVLCKEDTCKNGGVCTQDGTNEIFKCSCTEDYGGLTCEGFIP